MYMMCPPVLSLSCNPCTEVLVPFVYFSWSNMQVQMYCHAMFSTLRQASISLVYFVSFILTYSRRNSAEI